MKKIFYRGTEINILPFQDIEESLSERGINVNAAFEAMADDRENVFVSNGFIRGLKDQNEPGEWHHFFKKDKTGHFEAKKLSFT